MADLAHRKLGVPRRRRPWLLGLMLILLAVVLGSGGVLLHAEQSNTPTTGQTTAQPAGTAAQGTTATTAPASSTAAAGTTTPATASGEAGQAAPKRSLDQDLDVFDESKILEPLYSEVLEGWQKAGYKPTSGVSVSIDATRYSRKYASSVGSKARVQVASNLGGRAGRSLLWLDEETIIEWQVTVPKSGLYNIAFVYYPLDGKRASIQRDMKIDGKYPFNEAKRLLFERAWQDDKTKRNPDGSFPKSDNRGNDIRPGQKEVRVWAEKKFADPQGMYRSPFLFYLSAGKHTLTMNAIREPIALSQIKITSPVVLPTYAQVKQAYDAKGYKPANSELIRFQTEFANMKADPTIRSEYSYDPSTIPASQGKERLNVFGGWRWRKGEQWAQWKITVPENGLYKIGFKVWQGWAERLPSARKIEIDGRVPFQEAEEFLFEYDRDYRITTFADKNGDPYYIYLTKGEHTIRMTSMVGPMARTIRMLKWATLELSKLNRAIVMITGPTPDPNFDWEIHKKIPELLPRLKALEQRFADEVKWMRSVAPSSRYADSFDLTRSIMSSMIRKPDTITSRLNEFSEQELMLSNSLLSLQYAPLEMDYMMIGSADAKFPNIKPTAWQRFRAGAASFLLSFTKDYTGVGNVYKEDENSKNPNAPKEKVLELWIGWGREWAAIIKEMIEEDFTPYTGVKVNVNVIPAGALDPNSQSILLLSAAAGQSPDLSFGTNSQLPVEFAIRGGVMNLNKFPDYKEVVKRFRPGALIPYKYRGGDYALPETQDFQMMFYRKDILQQYNLKPPETWEQVIEMLPTLQQSGMNFYYSGGFTPFLYQHGGDFYFADGWYSALDSPQALAAFKAWTDLYANYKIPVEANFYNRMRSGEMPIGIANYSTYVLLSTAAPELTGWWEMRPIPGVRKANGSVDRTAAGGASTAVIYSQTKYAKEAWELTKWWTSTEIQARFGEETEAVLGVEARWNTANVEALMNMPWPKADIEAIQEQWKWFKEQPIVLGGYFTGRHITNAWNRVVLEGMNPREALEIAVKDIDRELAKKQEEFGTKVPTRKEYYAKYGLSTNRAPGAALQGGH